MNKWLEWMHSDENQDLIEEEEKFLSEHWANDLLDSPHALIAVIETKIARAVIAREREIIELLEPEVVRHYESGLYASAAYLENLIALIKKGTK